MLWQTQDLARLLAQDPHWQAPENIAGITGVQIDSRQIQKGDLFIPLAPPISARDGHQFIDAALASGANLTLSAQRTDHPQVLPVSNTQLALQTLALGARRRLSNDAAIIAITGSSGKTTLRTWLQHTLTGFGRTHGSEGSFNNHLGVPLSLARMPADTQYGVFEVGTNHPGEIQPLSELVAPTIAVVLNVLPVHIGHFASFDALVQEKLSLRSGLTSSGHLILQSALSTSEPGPHSTFGTAPSATIRWEHVAGAQAAISVGKRRYALEMPALGAHLIPTAAACLAVIQALGLDIQMAINRLASAPLPIGRGNIEQIGGITLVDESYNANPESMGFALKALATPGSGRCHVILGEMHELGDLSPSAHERVLALGKAFDTCLAVGRSFGAAAAEMNVTHVDHCQDIDLRAYVARLSEGDTVMVKGSNQVFWKHQFMQSLRQTIVEATLS